MREFTYDTVSGNLGWSVNSYQRTLKRKAGKTPWKQIIISGYGGELLVSASFNGETYSDELMLRDGEEMTLAVSALGVRVRVPRRKKFEFVSYDIYCRD